MSTSEVRENHPEAAIEFPTKPEHFITIEIDSKKTSARRAVAETIEQVAAELGGGRGLTAWALESEKNETVFWTRLYPLLLLPSDRESNDIARETIQCAAADLGGSRRFIAWASKNKNNETAFWTRILSRFVSASNQIPDTPKAIRIAKVDLRHR